MDDLENSVTHWDRLAISIVDDKPYYENKRKLDIVIINNHLFMMLWLLQL